MVIANGTSGKSHIIESSKGTELIVGSWGRLGVEGGFFVVKAACVGSGWSVVHGRRRDEGGACCTCLQNAILAGGIRSRVFQRGAGVIQATDQAIKSAFLKVGPACWASGGERDTSHGPAAAGPMLKTVDYP